MTMTINDIIEAMDKLGLNGERGSTPGISAGAGMPMLATIGHGLPIQFTTMAVSTHTEPRKLSWRERFYFWWVHPWAQRPQHTFGTPAMFTVGDQCGVGGMIICHPALRAVLYRLFPEISYVAPDRRWLGC